MPKERDLENILDKQYQETNAEGAIFTKTKLNMIYKKVSAVTHLISICQTEKKKGVSIFFVINDHGTYV